MLSWDWIVYYQSVDFLTASSQVVALGAGVVFAEAEAGVGVEIEVEVEVFVLVAGS